MKIRDDNYFTVKGWMLTRLGLKGTQLLLYAIIYGFSQDGKSEFKGSVGYLAEFTGVTEVSARSNLKELEEKGLIRIKAGASGDVNTYSVVIGQETGQNEAVIDFSATGGINTYRQRKEEEKRHREAVREIVTYLNEKTGKKYRADAYETWRPIEARLHEGFTVEDCKKVIDIKAEEWLGDEKMEKYLRPQTLFGTKFQSYLNQKTVAKKIKREASYNLDAVKSKDISGNIVYRKKN